MPAGTGSLYHIVRERSGRISYMRSRYIAFCGAKYIVKRVIAAVLTLLVLITVVFFLVRLMPGEQHDFSELSSMIIAC